MLDEINRLGIGPNSHLGYRGQLKAKGMNATEPTVGDVYWVKWRARDIGYGVERGSDEYTYCGREPIGKLIFQRVDDEQVVYLFEDEIIYCERDS